MRHSQQRISWSGLGLMAAVVVVACAGFAVGEQPGSGKAQHRGRAVVRTRQGQTLNVPANQQPIVTVIFPSNEADLEIVAVESLAPPTDAHAAAQAQPAANQPEHEIVFAARNAANRVVTYNFGPNPPDQAGAQPGEAEQAAAQETASLPPADKDRHLNFTALSGNESLTIEQIANHGPVTVYGVRRSQQPAQPQPGQPQAQPPGHPAQPGQPAQAAPEPFDAVVTVYLTGTGEKPH